LSVATNADLSQFEPWFIGSQRVGFIHRDFSPVVAARPDLFTHRDGAWHLQPALDTPAKRTAAMRAFLLELRERGSSATSGAKRPIRGPGIHRPAAETMERAAVPGSASAPSDRT